MALPQPAALPLGHPAAVQFSKWLSAFNTADLATLVAYHGAEAFPYSVASRDINSPANELALSKSSGGFNLAIVESTASPDKLVVVLKEKNRPIHARVEITVDVTTSSYRTVIFNIQPISTPLELIPPDAPRRKEYEKAYRKLDDTLKQQIITGVAGILRDQYVYPDLGEKIIRGLNERYEEGVFKTLETSEDFARNLTQAMYEVSHDLHMSVRFHEPPPPPAGGDKYQSRLPELFELFVDRNFGFGPVVFDTNSVPGKKIATLVIDGFLPFRSDSCVDGDKIRDAMGRILTDVADSNAVLVDLRGNHGGDPNTVAFILSYFLGDDGMNLHLLDMVDRTGKVQRSFLTTPSDQLPVGTRRYGSLKPLYVLTSKDTISGGEDMATNFQAFKRGIIIGQDDTTAGAANPVSRARHICDEEFGKGWWMAAVPDLRPVHRITGTGWEGHGVLSDVVAGKNEWKGVTDAGEVARRLAMRELERRVGE